MAEKVSERDESPPITGGKRVERPSSSSSPEIPPNKTAKTTEHMVEHADLSSIWIALNKIQRNTDELLKENRALRKQHEELQKSLEFHIDKLEKLEAENNKLKQDVSSLKKEVRKAEDEVADLKGHSHLVHMRIRYHFLADLRITLHHKSRAEKRIL